NATAEEVANKVFGTPSGAAFITAASPLYGIDPSAQQVFPAEMMILAGKGPAAEKTAPEDLAVDGAPGPLDNPNKDPVAASAPSTLTGGAATDQAVANQTKGKLGAGLDASSLAKELGIVKASIGDLARPLAKL